MACTEAASSAAAAVAPCCWWWRNQRSDGRVCSTSKPNGWASSGTGRKPSSRTNAGCSTRKRCSAVTDGLPSTILTISALRKASAGCGFGPGLDESGSPPNVDQLIMENNSRYRFATGSCATETKLREPKAGIIERAPEGVAGTTTTLSRSPFFVNTHRTFEYFRPSQCWERESTQLRSGSK